MEERDPLHRFRAVVGGLEKGHGAPGIGTGDPLHHPAKLILREAVDRQLVVLHGERDRLVRIPAGAEVPEPFVGLLDRGRLEERSPMDRAVGEDRRRRILAVGVGVVGDNLREHDRGRSASSHGQQQPEEHRSRFREASTKSPDPAEGKEGIHRGSPEKRPFQGPSAPRRIRPHSGGSPRNVRTDRHDRPKDRSERVVPPVGMRERGDVGVTGQPGIEARSSFLEQGKLLREHIPDPVVP